MALVALSKFKKQSKILYIFNSDERILLFRRNGSLDLLMADSPVLDYYRATDHGCRLQRIGETFVEDTYAIGMIKGFPLKESISALIAKYSSNGYLDILSEKWYGGLPCYKYEVDIVQPRPLGNLYFYRFILIIIVTLYFLYIPITNYLQ